VRRAVQASVAESPYFQESDETQNALRVETLESDGELALQLHLLRQGWEVRAPEPRRIRVMPWIAVLAGVLGAFVALVFRRASAGLLLAGVLGQLLLAFVPAGELPLRKLSWTEEVASGPMLEPIIQFVRGWGPMGTAIAGGIVVFCMVLVAFDHRRSKDRDESMGLGGAGILSLLATFGMVSWAECAMRGSMVHGMFTWQGALAWVALLAAWVPPLLAVRERWRG
jgi:hypothetical protein